MIDLHAELQRIVGEFEVATVEGIRTMKLLRGSKQDLADIETLEGGGDD